MATLSLTMASLTMTPRYSSPGQGRRSYKTSSHEREWLWMFKQMILCVSKQVFELPQRVILVLSRVTTAGSALLASAYLAIACVYAHGRNKKNRCIRFIYWACKKFLFAEI